MSHKGKKLSHQDQNRPSTHQFPTIKALKAQINTLQKQVEEIKQNTYQPSNYQQGGACDHNITLMKLSQKDRCFNPQRINQNIGFLEKQLIQMRDGFKLTSYVNNIITCVEYEFQVLDSTSHEKEFQLQELDKVTQQLKYQLLEIETEKHLHLHDNQEQNHIINNQDQKLNEQLIKLNDYQAIINSYQNQNLQLTYELKQTDQAILELKQRFEQIERKKDNHLGVELEWKEKLNRQKEKSIKLQTENQYYEDYLEDVFETVRKMEQELIFCRKELKRWKERYFQEQ